MEAKDHEELRMLKEYNKYLNEEGIKRLAYLWNKADSEYEEQKKNGH